MNQNKHAVPSYKLNTTRDWGAVAYAPNRDAVVDEVHQYINSLPFEMPRLQLWGSLDRDEVLAELKQVGKWEMAQGFRTLLDVAVFDKPEVNKTGLFQYLWDQHKMVVAPACRIAFLCALLEKAYDPN